MMLMLTCLQERNHLFDFEAKQITVIMEKLQYNLKQPWFVVDDNSLTA